MKTLLKIIGIVMWIITFTLWWHIGHTTESSFLDGFLAFIVVIVVNLFFDFFLFWFFIAFQDTKNTMDKIRDKLLK